MDEWMDGCFDIYDFTEEISGFKNVPSDVTVHIDSGTVLISFERPKIGRVQEGIGGCILKNCTLQLADIFYFLFNMSLQTHRVPGVWKDSVIVPVSRRKPFSPLMTLGLLL